MKKGYRKIAGIGRKSLGVVIPVEIIKKLGWKKKHKVTVSFSNNKVIVKDYEK